MVDLEEWKMEDATTLLPCEVPHPSTSSRSPAKPPLEGEPELDVAQESSSSPCSLPLDKINAAKRRSTRRHEVWLHVYDIDRITANLNWALLQSVNLGAYHCGVEVLGDEWFFAWGESDFSGVLWNIPRSHQVHIYKESLSMGKSELAEDEIREVIANAMDTWPANSYHPITRNCVDFAEELIINLQCPEPFPRWVRGAIDAGKSAALFPIADWGWRWVKWWCASDRNREADRSCEVLRNC